MEFSHKRYTYCGYYILRNIIRKCIISKLISIWYFSKDYGIEYRVSKFKNKFVLIDTDKQEKIVCRCTLFIMKYSDTLIIIFFVSKYHFPIITARFEINVITYYQVVCPYKM